MIVRMRIPRPDLDTLTRNVVFTLIAALFAVTVYLFFSVRMSFDHVFDTLRGVLP